VEPRTELMHSGAKLASELPDWVKLAIADAIMLFGRLEQEVIEIAWVIQGAEQEVERTKVARNPATDNFSDIVAIVEQAAGQEFAALKATFEDLAKDRNLIVHGAERQVDRKGLAQIRMRTSPSTHDHGAIFSMHVHRVPRARAARKALCQF
jgi:hypothetical protein